MERKHVKVYGSVQGVGFRYFTERTASSMDLTGWVRNLPDGTVEIEAQGNSETLEHFIGKVRQGPTFSDVENLDVAAKEVEKNESAFQIRY